MMEFVVNANFKGDYGKPINLHKLHKRVVNSKLQYAPFQLVIRDLKGTIIVFSNGKFRVMGCIDELEASFMPFAYLQKIKRRPMNKFPLITLQSYTLKCNLGFKVDLPKLSAALLTAEVPYVYEPELFPALLLKKYKPISMNIFSTGTVMVCGIKNYDEMYTILPQLKQLCQPYRR